MVVPVLTNNIMAGDVFIRDDLSREYSIDSVLVANAGATPVFYQAGTPMVGAVFANEAALAGTTVDGFVFESMYVQPGGTRVPIARRPEGIVINSNMVPLTDPAGNALLLTAYQTTWTRLGWVARAEPAQQTVQTT
jgi:hypothetical protein